MPLRTGLLGLGSNLGDRRANLQAAVARLPGAGVEVEGSSSVYDTDPVGEVTDQPSFLNACLRVRTTHEPLALLDAVKRLEGELGRFDGPNPPQRHGPRAIDIDVLLLGDIELRHERMCLPHAQVLSRRFVLVPALELDFALRTPDGSRLADALAALPTGEGVRWAGGPLSVAVGSFAGGPAATASSRDAVRPYAAAAGAGTHSAGSVPAGISPTSGGK
jgi:2-amino-4-hydroxy-6-hydroxymethyldihydropteridine diphosphokinase